MKSMIYLLAIYIASIMCTGCVYVANETIAISFIDHDHVCIKGKTFPLRTTRDGTAIRLAYPNTLEFILSNIQYTSFRNIYNLKDYNIDDSQALNIKYANFSIITTEGMQVPIVFFGRASNNSSHARDQEHEVNLDVDSWQNTISETPKSSFFLQLWCNTATTQGKDLLAVIDSFSEQLQTQQCSTIYIMPY